MRAYKVSEINNYIYELMAKDYILSEIRVEGEISNFIHHRSGHMYFSLKDQDSVLKSVMFKGNNRNLDLELEDGLKVVASGYIGAYEKGGIYQLYVREIEPSGLGELYKIFENLKKSLAEEGLFSEDHKKALPSLPKKIGVVTSPTGAAIKDIINVIKRRYPLVDILIYPSQVQGVDSARSIIEGLLYLEAREDVDVIIFGRGGGSMEDLFSFNDELLARTIYAMKTPTVSAVGHEIDFTIGDFVADVRAATPSSGAELVVPSILDLKGSLEASYDRILMKTLATINLEKERLDKSKTLLRYLNPSQKLLNQKIDLDNTIEKIYDVLESRFRAYDKDLLVLKNRLDFNNPSIYLDKGYSILYDRDNNVIRTVDGLAREDEIKVMLKDGSLKAIVNSVSKEKRDED